MVKILPHLAVPVMCLLAGCSAVQRLPQLGSPGPGTLLARVLVAPACECVVGQGRPGAGKIAIGFEEFALGRHRESVVLVHNCSYDPRCELRGLVTVSELVAGKMRPVAVDQPKWSRLSRTMMRVDDNKIAVLEVNVGQADLGSKDSPATDCLAVLSLDGAAATQTCFPSARTISPFGDRADIVDGRYYFCGALLMPGSPQEAAARAGDAHALVLQELTIAGQLTTIDSGGSGSLCGGVVHDKQAIYWSVPEGIRRVERADGRASTIFRPNPQQMQNPPMPLVVAGDSLLVATFLASETSVYRIGKHADTYTRRGRPLLQRTGVGFPRMVADERAVYVFWPDQLIRVSLADGSSISLAEPLAEGELDQPKLLVDVTVIDDTLYYLVVDSRGPSIASIWSVGK